MNSMVALARSIAELAHADQFDKIGQPYIGHPRRVARLVEAAGGSPQAIAAAWLHDVLEDSAFTPAAMAVEGIPAAVIEAVEVLTHRPYEPYLDYVRRVAAHPLAIEVKRADLADNTEPRRLAALPVEVRTRLVRKYASAQAILDVDSTGVVR